MNYIDWHYFEIWPKILILWRNSILFAFYYFSIPLHIRSLFIPWHRQAAHKKIGFHLIDILEVIFFNIFSRIIGSFVRLCTIVYGLFFMLLVIILGLIPVVIWPIMVGFSLFIYLSRKPSLEKEPEYYWKLASGNLIRLGQLLFNHGEGLFVIRHLGWDIKVIQNLFKEDNKPLGQIQNTKQKPLPPRTTMANLYKYIAENYLPLAKILMQNNLKSDIVFQTACWYEKLHQEKDPPLILDLPRIQRIQGIGHDWAYGFTVELDKYTRDLTKKIPIFPILVHREKELDALQRILIKSQGNNPLIVGEPGVARHLLVEILAYHILFGQAHSQLSCKRILSLNMHSLISSKPTILEVKGLTDELLDEAQGAGNIIICIDDIEKYLSEGNGRIDLIDVISKFAESPIGIIGITNPVAYNKYISTNSTLSHLFEKVEVQPLDQAKTVEVLELSVSPVLEKKYRIAITYPAILKTVDDSNRYITTDPLPSKAIELLDEACIFITTVKKKTLLTASDIDEFLSTKMHMNIGSLHQEETQKLSNLENLLHERIINQEEAIRVISASLRRARLDVGNMNKPIGTFLFMGPTGVGKTETAKALAQVYFGSKDKLNRFDMSQYQSGEGIERLIGSIKLGSPGEMTSKIAEQPFSILLLDEFEKADKQIFNLFLTLFDEGYITESSGKKISAKNNIIIATSNAGAEFIRQRINQGIQNTDLQKELVEYVQKEKIFSPELLNRFDAVVVFTPLSEGHLREVAKLMLEDLNKRLAPKEIGVEITPDLIKKLASIGFDPQFGGRAMRRAITENVEDQVAQKLLTGEVKKGEEIIINI